MDKKTDNSKSSVGRPRIEDQPLNIGKTIYLTKDEENKIKAIIKDRGCSWSFYFREGLKKSGML